MTAEAYWDLAAEYLALHIEHEGPELVAAFLIEPVAQANGVRVPPPGYLQRVREICDEHQVLLIADEVITGFGRTGQWFAVDHWQIEPDIMTMGKGITAGYLPMAATICREEIRDALTVFPDVHTFGGHASAAVAAATAIAIYEDEGLVPRAADIGEQTLGRLERLEEVPAVGQVRGLGMWMAVDFVGDDARGLPDPGMLRKIVLRARELGVLVGQNGTSIEIATALNISEGDLDEGLSGFEQAIHDVADRHGNPATKGSYD